MPVLGVPGSKNSTHPLSTTTKIVGGIGVALAVIVAAAGVLGGLSAMGVNVGAFNTLRVLTQIGGFSLAGGSLALAVGGTVLLALRQRSVPQPSTASSSSSSSATISLDPLCEDEITVYIVAENPMRSLLEEGRPYVQALFPNGSITTLTDTELTEDLETNDAVVVVRTLHGGGYLFGPEGTFRESTQNRVAKATYKVCLNFMTNVYPISDDKHYGYTHFEVPFQN